MANSIDRLSQNIANNLIYLRKTSDLTQSGLAKLSGVTRASITLLESGTANPTLEILHKVSMALKVSIDEITSTPQVECRHIPAADIPLDKKSKRGVTLRKLLPDKVRATEMDELQLEAGAVMTGSPHTDGTKEYFTCINGQVLISVLGHSYLVKKGDVLCFPGDKPHSYKNPGKKTAQGVSVVIFNPS